MGQLFILTNAFGKYLIQKPNIQIGFPYLSNGKDIISYFIITELVHKKNIFSATKPLKHQVSQRLWCNLEPWRFCGIILIIQ